MASILFKIKFIGVILLMMLSIISSIDSERIDCKKVVCPPPEVMENCPTDSILTMVLETTTTTTTTTTMATTTSTSTTTTTTTPSPLPILSTTFESEETDSELNMITKNVDETSLAEKNSTLDNENESEIDSTITSKAIENFNSTDISSSITTIETTTLKPRRNRKKNRTTEAPEKQLRKRSLRYHRRESIKIVPGDYRNFDEYFQRYYNQKWKRSIATFPEGTGIISELRSKQSTTGSGGVTTGGSSNISVFKECCPRKIPTCVCRNDCERPVCVDTKQILVQIKQGNASLPGQCCPEYVCVDAEPDCSLYMKTEKIFWPSKCRMCQCIHGIKFCHEICPSPNHQSSIESDCYSDSTLERKLYKEGDTWKEDDCTDCECENGIRRCFIVQCKALYNCKVQKKIPGECCAICDDDNLKTTTTTTENPITTTTKIEEITTTTELSTTPVLLCPTVAPALEPSKRITNFIQDNIVTILIIVVILLILGITSVGILYAKALRKPKDNKYLSIPNGDSNSSQNHIENGGANANTNHHRHNHHNSQHSNSSSN